MKTAFKKLQSKTKNYLSTRISRTKQTDSFLPQNPYPSTDIEQIFTTSDGIQIPVYKHHRYSLKKSWSVFGPVAALSELNSKNLLDNKDISYLEHIKGHRTITEPFSDIREKLSPYLKKHADMFISPDIPHIGRRLLKPTNAEVETLISKKAHQHKTLADKINKLTNNTCLQPNDKVLEIGYTSGGESIIAFEKLGFQAYGIDNFYYDSIEATSRQNLISQITGTKAHFDVGDITTRTLYDDNTLSMAYSLSVLEHIADIPAAFREMHRILKPGGIMCHRYDPFFHASGAHSLATLDAPWAHMRMSDSDLQRYIRELRPHEADVSLPWIKNALNRRHTINFIQTSLVAAGFKIRLWESESIAERNMRQLTPDIMSECLLKNPNITIHDLTSKAILFVAQKD